MSWIGSHQFRYYWLFQYARVLCVYGAWINTDSHPSVLSVFLGGEGRIIYCWYLLHHELKWIQFVKFICLEHQIFASCHLCWKFPAPFHSVTIKSQILKLISIVTRKSKRLMRKCSLNWDNLFSTLALLSQGLHLTINVFHSTL